MSAHPVTLVELSEVFKRRVVQGYTNDLRWIRIQKMLDTNDRLGENVADLPYKVVRRLIYFKDIELGLQLCIPESLIPQVFRLVHDELGHQGYDCTYRKLSEGLYIFNMAKHLCSYLRHCPQCQLHCTPRHPIHGSLQPILTPPRPFHTISIDFILALPITAKGSDCVMSVTCKFSKAITLIEGKIAISGKEWAVLLLDRLALLLWGRPRAILSDRDRHFVGQLWKGIFEHLSVDLLYSTSYYPQTDSMSERSNQTVEIALRHYLATLPEGALNQWPSVLPCLSLALNNSMNFSLTGKTPTQVIHGFRAREALDFLRADDNSELIDIPDHERLDTNNGDQTDAHPVTTRSQI